MFGIKKLFCSSKGSGLIILIRCPVDMTDYPALRAANRAQYEEKVRLSLVQDLEDPFSDEESTAPGGETPSGRGVVARLEGETSRLAAITRSNTEANIIVRILLLVYLLFLTLDCNANMELLRTPTQLRTNLLLKMLLLVRQPALFLSLQRTLISLR
jgi:hypothetical protein